MANQRTDKIILCCSFDSADASSLRSFFTARGYMTLFSQGIIETLQYCRENACSLVCVRVHGYDTSWIQFVTSAAFDPLIYQAPLLLVCSQKDYRFFRQQKHTFQYELLVEPLSLRILSDVLNRLESPSLPLSLSLHGRLLMGRDMDGTQRALCVDSSASSLSFLAYRLFRFDDVGGRFPRSALPPTVSLPEKVRCAVFKRSVMWAWFLSCI